MTIPKEYKELLERGDIAKLVKLTGRKRSTIYNILGGEECKSQMVYLKICGFFQKRSKELATLNKETDQN